ncbi:shikimate dehydrogenase [Geovibrio ferrireducens]|uniref:shikimate dehydrogenase n=1 Tax=Geovibrio ferrireducens TaxID=46201 RepID=UPI002248483A|nr:shikimate dehydrogenase [Geovibrio ferrireducens]
MANRALKMYLNLGLIGNPLSHTLSPSLHSRFLISAGINGGYVCFETPSKDKLPEVFDTLKKFRFRGVNVTVPYKEDVISFMNELDPLADDLRAVNTVLFEEGRAKGFNTDVHGFAETLRENKLDFTGSKVLMLGCGGAAKAVLRCLKDFRNIKLTVVNRDTAKAEKILKFLNFDNAEICDYNYISREAVFDSVINATSIGLDGSPFADMSKIKCTQAAVDLQYKPWVTPFLKCYENSGCKTVNGFSMLVHQAHKAFEIWTDKKACIDMPELIKLCGAAN